VRLLKRLLRRVAVLGLGVLTVWLIAFVFRLTDSRLPTVLALAITYGLAAYIILPRIIRMSLKILQRKRVPRFTISADGLPGDPVNLVLTGTLQQLNAAFKLAGWSQADQLSLTSSWRMAASSPPTSGMPFGSCTPGAGSSGTHRSVAAALWAAVAGGLLPPGTAPRVKEVGILVVGYNFKRNPALLTREVTPSSSTAHVTERAIAHAKFPSAIRE